MAAAVRRSKLAWAPIRPSNSRNNGWMGVMVTKAGGPSAAADDPRVGKQKRKRSAAPSDGHGHKVRPSDSELQVINARASHTQPTDNPPLKLQCVHG